MRDRGTGARAGENAGGDTLPATTRPGATTATAAACSAVLAAAAYVLAAVLRDTYPFGEVNRNTNDLGQQFVPMYARYRDVLTGEADGDLVLSWGAGFGVPMLGDFMSYLGSTLSWMVVLFPRDRIDLAAFVITVVAFGLAAAAMTTYLRRLRPDGPVWLAVVLGLSYALCGWGVEQGVYMMTWLNGMVALPLLALLGDWMVTRRTVLALTVSPFVVALLWTSHFYTVYMATIGAGLLTVARVLTLDRVSPWRTRLAALGGAVVAVGLGIGLSAPLLAPTFRAVQFSRPSPDETFDPVSVADFLTRALPGTAGVGVTPAFAVGTLALLLAVGLPFNPRATVRDRLVWPSLLLLMVLSMQLAPTMALWHGFDTPNGSPYRQAFVLAGMVVVAGWISASAGLESPRTVVLPPILVGAGYVLALDSPALTTATKVLVPAVAVVGVLAWTLLHRRRSVRTWVPTVVVVAVVATVLAESALTAAAVEDRREESLVAFAPWGPEQTRARELVLAADAWPQHRVSPGRHTGANDPLLIGGQGAEYYSSTIPDDLSEALLDLGFGYSSYGRAPIDPANPVVDAVFAVGARVVDSEAGTGNPAQDLILSRRDVAPLVTVRDTPSPSPSPSPDPVPFGPQETALGADVYSVPDVTAHYSNGLQGTTRRSGEIDLTPNPDAPEVVELRLTARCDPGTQVYLWAPMLVGRVRVEGEWEPVLRPTAKRPGVYTGAPLHHVGAAGPDGRVEVTLELGQATRLPQQPLGCLDETRLAAAVTGLQQRGPTHLEAEGHTLRATFPPSAADRSVVVAVVRTPGWLCTTGTERRTPPGELAGLISVPLSAGEDHVACALRPRGLTLGLATGAASLVGVGLLGAALAVLRRRTTLL